MLVILIRIMNKDKTIIQGMVAFLSKMKLGTKVTTPCSICTITARTTYGMCQMLPLVFIVLYNTWSKHGFKVWNKWMFVT